MERVRKHVMISFFSNQLNNVPRLYIRKGQVLKSGKILDVLNRDHLIKL